MYAIVVEKDLSLRWKEVPDPIAAPGEVVIDVHAAALNRADLLQRQGKYPPPPGSPPWMGLEVSGIISQVESSVGKTYPWKIGDRVCALLGGGGYAEKVNVPAGLLMPVPAGLSMVEAASLPEAFATAYLNLFIEGNLSEGETFFVYAGASGVGIAAVQLAKAYGARVVTTVSSEEKADAIRSLGADWIVNRTTTNLADVFEQCETEGRPVDVVLDCVGGRNMGKHIATLAAGGRWILIATLGGTETELALRPLLNKGIRIIGSKLRNRTVATKEKITTALSTHIWPKIESGQIRPIVDTVLPIRQAEEAHRILEKQKNIGKVVLEVVKTN